MQNQAFCNQTITFICHFFFTLTSSASSVTHSFPHPLFVDIYCKCQLVVSRQDLSQSCIVIHCVAGQAEKTRPQPVTALIQGLQQRERRVKCWGGSIYITYIQTHLSGEKIFVCWLASNIIFLSQMSLNIHLKLCFLKCMLKNGFVVHNTHFTKKSTTKIILKILHSNDKASTNLFSLLICLLLSQLIS